MRCSTTAKLRYELGGGVFNEAINILKEYIERYPSSERATAARELLVAAYYNSRDYDAAYEAIKSDPAAMNDSGYADGIAEDSILPRLGGFR